MSRTLALAIAVLVCGRILPAAVGLSTVPDRDQVRLTIYNAVDLTLAQDYRTLVFKQGMNTVQYQWAGTLIDTTSIEFRALERQADLEVVDLIYPPNAPATLVWRIESKIAGPVRCEIGYFTSGLSWSADYVLRASPDETKAEVEGTVAVLNNSGEEYPQAEVRLVLGTINLVERIRDLATGQEVARSRRLDRNGLIGNRGAFEGRLKRVREKVGEGADRDNEVECEKPAEVLSQRLADYHIFSISGRQAVPNGTTTRFLALQTKEPMPLEVLYRIASGSNQAQKLYRFINDEAHHLPKDGPLPDGTWNVFRVTDAKERTLSFSGATGCAYVPPDQKVELGLGHDPAIAVKERQTDYRETDFHYDKDRRVDGWIQHRTATLRLVNTKAIPISLEYLVASGGGDWEIDGLVGERRDQGTFRHQNRVEPGQVLELGPYTLSSRTGILSSLPDPDKPPITVPKTIPFPDIRTRS